MKFKDQVAYLCANCRKGFKRSQLTKVRTGHKNKMWLKCNNCIEQDAKDIAEKTGSHIVTVYKYILALPKNK